MQLILTISGYFDSTPGHKQANKFITLFRRFCLDETRFPALITRSIKRTEKFGLLISSGFDKGAGIEILHS